VVRSDRFVDHNVFDQLERAGGTHQYEVDLTDGRIGWKRVHVATLVEDLPRVPQQTHDAVTATRVEVAGQHHGMFDFCKELGHGVGLSKSLLRRTRQVNRHDRDDTSRPTCNLDFVNSELAPRSLWDLMGDHASHRKSSQHRVAVLTSLVRSVRSVEALVAKQFGQDSDLIDATRPFRVLVDFLKGDDIGIEGPEDLGDTRQIDLLVHTAAVLDVVRRNPERRLCRDRWRGAREQHEQPDHEAATSAHQSSLNSRPSNMSLPRRGPTAIISVLLAPRHNELAESHMEILKSYNPANGEVVGEVRVTPTSEIPALVTRARAAQKGWDALGLEERAEVIRKASAIFAERAQANGEIMTREMGKPLKEAVGEAKSVGHMDHELDEMVAALSPEVVEDPRLRSTIYHDPLGVVGAITPWNFPMSMPAWMILPALAAGNTVIFKPSEETPLCGQAYADALNEVLPEDVLIVVHGADDQGKAIVQSDVDMIAFTGSREVGKHIMREAAGTLKRVVLELGGKDPMIVLEHADITKAAKFAMWNSFRNAGQVCVSTERIFVLDSVAEEFESALAEMTATMKIGDGMDNPDMGPMVNSVQRDHVLSQLDAAISAGAKVLVGGEGHHDNFIIPTVLTDVTEDMDIACTETFGPVAVVTRVSSVDEAVDKANNTHFGLGAVVFGEDTDDTAAVARRLTAGMIGMNRAAGGAVGTPWVGARQSGLGFHKSPDGHKQFTQARVVTAPL
jgi:acyl-CoA reductase-like NAD-dependent aldehyde dehydrogenase